jgi:hypothetical protein
MPDAIGGSDEYLEALKKQLIADQIMSFNVSHLLSSDTCEYLLVPINSEPKAFSFLASNEGSIELAFILRLMCVLPSYMPRSVLVDAKTLRVQGYFFGLSAARLIRVSSFRHFCSTSDICRKIPQFFEKDTPLGSLEDVSFTILKPEETIAFIGKDELDFRTRVYSQTEDYSEITKEESESRFLSNYSISETYVLLGTPVKRDLLPGVSSWVFLVLNLLIASSFARADVNNPIFSQPTSTANKNLVV